MKPMLCFDIDGTLRDNVHHEVCPSTLKALHMLKQAGIKWSYLQVEVLIL